MGTNKAQADIQCFWVQIQFRSVKQNEKEKQVQNNDLFV